MAVKVLKPITPGQRGRVVNGFDAITTNKPEKSLLSVKKRTGGRNSQGKMTMKFKGGGQTQFKIQKENKRNHKKRTKT
jgi:large subunit ribosomal protein L2